MKNFSAHQKEKDLRISKITKLLFLHMQCHFWGSYGLSNMGTFFLGHPVETLWGPRSPKTSSQQQYSLCVIALDTLYKVGKTK